MADETLDILDAADLFSQSIDENGFMPGDEGYVEPVAEEEEEEEETEEETEEESEEEESEEESEEEEKPDEGTLFEIQIGEDTYEVNEEELKAGYLRNENYVARSTELEREYEERSAKIAEREIAVEAELDGLIALQQAGLNRFRGINWHELKELDPDQYREKRVEFMEEQERVNILNSRKQELQKLQQEQAQVKHAAYLEQQQALAAKLIPEIKDPAFQTKLIAYGKEVGYTEDELRNVADARQLLLLNQARLYAESQVRKKDALEKKVPTIVPKVAKPGTPQAPGKAKAKQVASARDAFAKSGDVRAAANYFATAIKFD